MIGLSQNCLTNIISIKLLWVSHPNFGNVRGVEKVEKNTYTVFLHNKINYAISTGYIYPILGAFRSLVKYDTEKHELYWLFDPIEIWEEVGTSLVQNTFETFTNPQLAGKDKQLWLSNYRIVETQSLRKLLNTRM